MHLVVFCTSCRRVSLAEASEARGGPLACSSCQGIGRVIPSCSYAAADLGLFAELSEIVAEGRIDALEAARLSFQAERSLGTRSLGPFFETLSSRLPGVTPIQLNIARDRPAQRRALTMLRSIFDALATGLPARTMPAVPAPALLEGEKRPA